MQDSARVWVIAILLYMLSAASPSVQAQDPTQSHVSVEWFVKWIRQCELERFERGIDNFTSKCCKLLVSVNQQQEALKLWKRAFVALKESKGNAESHDLLRSAIEMKRLDLAERVLAEAGSQRDSMLDQIAVAKYIQGDKLALEHFPHGAEMMTFYDAMELGHAYIETDELEKLEELLTDLEITEENEPEDVAGLLYKHIARTARERGDMEAAKKYIDKAYQVAGKQFYTGFTIDVVRRSMHGNLLKDVEEMAEFAEAHQGHMGGELLQGLIYELMHQGEYDTAEQIAQKFLEREQDQSEVTMSIAKGQAQNGDYRRAMGLMRRLEDTESQDLVRLEVAKALLKVNKTRAATVLADFVKSRMQPTKEYSSRYSSLAEFEGMLGEPARINEVIQASDDPYRGALRFLKSFEGHLAAKSNAEKEEPKE